MTNAVLQAIADRRSIRAFKDEQISDEQLDILLTAAQQAPSAYNAQPWHFTVVQNKDLIDRISESTRQERLKTADETARANLNSDSYHAFYHAPTVIFVSTDMSASARHSRHDCGLAVENITLAAHSIGLGSVILAMPGEAFKGENAGEYKKTLCFPEGHDYIVSIGIGVPAMTKEAHPIKENRVNIVR